MKTTRLIAAALLAPFLCTSTPVYALRAGLEGRESDIAAELEEPDSATSDSRLAIRGVKQAGAEELTAATSDSRFAMSPPLMAGAEEQLTLPEPLAGQPLGSYEALLREVLQAIRDGQRATGAGQYWVAISGLDCSGKTQLANTLAAQLGNPPDVVRLDEDQLGIVDRPTRSAWEHPQDPRWLDYRNHWLRWENIRSGLAAVREARRSTVELTQLYNRSTGLTDERRTVQVGPVSVIIYDGIYPLDPVLYPSGTFDLQILLDVTPAESVRRQIDRDVPFGRDAETVRQLFDTRYLPRWRDHVASVHPERHADLVYDMTDLDNPVRLRYPSSATQAGAEEVRLIGEFVLADDLSLGHQLRQMAKDVGATHLVSLPLGGPTERVTVTAYSEFQEGRVREVVVGAVIRWNDESNARDWPATFTWAPYVEPDSPPPRWPSGSASVGPPMRESPR